MQDKKLFLLDAMALIYRAYFAFQKNPRINSAGFNTSAVFGFANTLFDVLRNEKPTHIGVAFDTAAPTQRHEDFTAYKAHREEAPEDLIKSLPYIHELLEAFGIPVLIKEGYEADDIIGTLAKQAEQKDFMTYMMTSDKDFGQLVSDRVVIYRPGKFGGDAEVLGPKEVCEKFGIERTEQVKDILGLWGDAADNIPGIPGVGEVTAKKLVSEFGSVENLVANPEKVANEKLRQKVVEFKDQALLSKQLATIILDVPVEFSEENLKAGHPDEARLKKLFDELEFRNFGQRIFTWLSLNPFGESQQAQGIRHKAQEESHQSAVGSQQSEEQITTSPPLHITTKPSVPDLFSDPETLEPRQYKTIENTPHTYHLADTAEKRAELVKILSSSKSFCFDTETTGIDPNSSELVGMSFAVKPFEAWYVPLPDDKAECTAVVGEFKHVLEDPSIEKIGQNMKFDISILRWYGVNVAAPLFDTMLAHYLIQPDMRHNMDLLAETYLGYSPVSIEKLIGKKGQQQLSMRTVETETIKEYAAEDADVTFQLKQIFGPMLEKAGARELFDTIEVPLIPVLASMEAEGVRIDTKVLNVYSGELGTEIRKLEEAIYQDAGTTFNIASPKQLGDILYVRMKIVENPRQTKTKQFSTSEDVLIRYENRHPIIGKILEYRSLTKLKSTYVDVLPTLVNPRDGRLHTSYNQAVAATGRLSSNNPNLQNIPIRTEKGREIRKAFVPRGEGYQLLSADYSQIELRIIAHLAKDKEMIEDFRSGQDIHAATAAKIFNVTPENVTKEMRRNAKAVNFGIIYGMSAFGLSDRLNIPRKEAADIISQYFTRYSGIKKYLEETIAFARKHGYVETMMKRRRYIRDITSGNATIRGFAERNAINAPIQGTAADMIKIAMIRVQEAMMKQPLKSKMILQVHDELVFDAWKEETEMLKELVREGMQNAITLDVPVLVEMDLGENWLEAH
jgi:DNA polymerase I